MTCLALILALLFHFPGKTTGFFAEEDSFQVVLDKGGAYHRKGDEPSSLNNNTVTSAADLYIVGGDISQAGDFPWYVSSTTRSYCGGSLVHEQVVLTAAHCAPVFLTGTTVEIGATVRNLPEVNIRRVITRVLRHPSYDRNMLRNDFLLLKLLTPVRTVEPVRLNEDEDSPAVDDVVTVMGFGMNGENGVMQRRLQHVDLFVEDPDECAEKYQSVAALDGVSKFQLDSDVILCAGYPHDGVGNCKGDSGGPLVTPRGVQVGVVSGGSGCAKVAFPGLYSRVSSAIDWIRSGICTLADNPPPECEFLDDIPDDGPEEEETASLLLRFVYDDHPGETSWYFSQGVSMLYEGPQYVPGPGQSWEISFSNIVPGRYSFTVLDSGCDGLTSGELGYFVVWRTDRMTEVLVEGDADFECRVKYDFDIE